MLAPAVVLWFRCNNIDTSITIEMALTSKGGHYTALLPSSTASEITASGDPSLHPESVEMITPTKRALQETPTLLSRRNSAASSRSEVSSQASKQTVHTFKRLFNWYNQRIRRSRFYGWRMGVLLGSCVSTFVLCCNITAVTVGGTISSGPHSGIVDIISGNALIISRWSTVFHILINVLSTSLLAASNYTMQVLSSPTRDDIDAAHAKGEWVDIGVLSIRNLRLIPRKRAVLFLLLASSSVPLHLFYNAAVFQVIADNEYNINIMDYISEEWQALNMTIAETSANVSDRSNDWFEIYNTEHVSGHGDLYLAVDLLAFFTQETNMAKPTTAYLPLQIGLANQHVIRSLAYHSSAWILWREAYMYHQGFLDQVSGSFNGSSLSFNHYNDSVRPYTAHVKSAISRTIQPESRIQLSLEFMIIVIVFNFLKLALMLWVLITDKSEYLVTLGDAITSFLQRPEPATSKKCMLGKKEFLWRHEQQIHQILVDDELERLDLRTGSWSPHQQSYFSSLPKDRRVFFVISFAGVSLGIITMAILLSSGTKAWATASQNSFSFGSSILLNAWGVNSPQIILSCCYIGLNSICTLIAGAKEWNNLPQSRKGLRVTRPAGEQRSTYFLQLPYRWAIPLAIASGTLHWLLSQSLFLVRIDKISRTGELYPDSSKTACGVSGLSFVVLLVVAFILLLAIGVVGSRQMRPNLPFAASCSLAISAACHPPEGDTDTHLKKVMWGVVEERVVTGFEHCSLSAKKVRRPEVGKTYY